METKKIRDALDGNFDSYELYTLRERTKKFESRDGEIAGVEFREEEGVALRAIIADGRMGFSSTYDTSDPGGKLLRNILPLIPLVEPDPDRFFPDLFGSYPVLPLYDSSGLATENDVKSSIVTGMEKTIREFDTRIVTVRNCELQEIEYEVSIENSRGLEAHSRKTIYVLSALCVAKEQDEVSWYDWEWSHELAGLDGQKLGKALARKALSFLSGSQIDTGVYDGILTPQAACDLLGILADSFLGEHLYKDKTKLKGREGEKVFSEAVTIVDSGLAGMDSFPFDGEGVPSAENTVVKAGVFESFLFDSYYGRKFNHPSTGNSARGGIKQLPVCSTRGLFITPGQADLGDCFDNGIIIEELMGTHTANTITGEFSLGALGYLVRKGERMPFQGVLFSGNIFDVLNNVKKVGNDLRFYGSGGSPSLFVEGMKISGR